MSSKFDSQRDEFTDKIKELKLALEEANKELDKSNRENEDLKRQTTSKDKALNLKFNSLNKRLDGVTKVGEELQQQKLNLEEEVHVWKHKLLQKEKECRQIVAVYNQVYLSLFKCEKDCNSWR